MKRLKHIWLLSCTIFALSITAQSYVEIGTGTISTSYPTYSVWNNGWFSMIQPQSAVGPAKTITKIAFNCINGPKTSVNQKIYLKHTSASIFGDASYENPSTNGYTLVYDGAINYNGWTEITLLTPFSYNGIDHLIIHYENRSNSANYANFASTASVTNNNKGAGNDASFPTGSGYLNPYPSSLPNVRLYYASTGPATPANPIPAVNAQKVNLNIQPTFELGTNTTSYDVYLSTDSASVASSNSSALVASNIAISTAGTYSYTPSNILAASTNYFWKVIAKDATLSESSIVWKFTTQNVISTMPYTQGFEGQDVIWDGYYGISDWSYPTTGNEMLWHKSSVDYARSGNNCMKADPSSSVVSVSSTLMSPRIFLPTNQRISFWWLNGQLAKTSGKDTTYFEVTNDGGITWTTLEILSPASAQNAYINVTKDLSLYAGNNTYIRWRYVKSALASSPTYIDDIVIEPIPSGAIMELSNTTYTYTPIYKNAHTKTRVAIRNNGTTNLVVTGATVSAPYTCTYSGTILPGTSDTATIVFDGTNVGIFNQPLTFNSNGTGANTVQLSGEVKESVNSFYETFDAVSIGQLPLSWSKLRSADPYQSLNDIAVKSSSIDAHSAPNVVKMYNNSDSISSLIMLTPGTTNFATNTFKFWASKTWGNINTVELIVGLMDDPYDATSFETVQSFTLADSMELFSLTFNPSNLKPYIAFKHGQNRQMQSIWVDDIEWQGIINQPPSAAAVVFPANDTINIEQLVTLKWTATGGNPTGYKLYVGTNNPPTNMVNGVDLGNVLQYAISNELDYSTNYFWKVVPYNNFGDATTCPIWEFKVMDDPTITVYPWNEGFESVTPGAGFNYPLGWRVINNNDAWACWDVIANSPSSPQNAHSGNLGMHTAFTYLNPQNDWLLTPPMMLQSGTTYQFSFWLKSPFYVDSQTQDTTFEKFEVMFGNAPITDSLSTVIYRNETLRIPNYTQISQVITPSTTGKYYVGFHTYSEPLQWLVIIDDVSMSILQGVSEHTSSNDISIYPNPSKGVFNVQLKNNLEPNATLRVLNTFGQEVYKNPLTSTNHTINISGLSDGFYFVNILNGSTSSTFKIIIKQ